MTVYEFAQGLGLAKFAFLCVSAMASAAAVVFLVLKITKELSLKIGNVAISLKGEEQKKDIVNLVFDFGEFQDALNDTRDLAVETLHKQAKRYTKTQVRQYMQRLRAEYAKKLESSEGEADSRRITTVVFNLFTNELKDSMFGYLMDIYEKNHLAAKSDQDLRSMAHDHYMKLADMFKDHAAGIWIPEMRPYSQVREISQGIAQFVEGLTYDILAFYKNQAATRNLVFDAARKVCSAVKAGVSESLRLPENAMYLAENFFTEENGLDATLVGEFLKK